MSEQGPDKARRKRWERRRAMGRGMGMGMGTEIGDWSHGMFCIFGPSKS